MIRQIIANGIDEKLFLKEYRDRNEAADNEITKTVRDIIEDVRTRGDEAVAEYTRRFDGAMPETVEIGRDAMLKALDEADADFVAALKRAKANIEDFHSRQKQQGFINVKADGVILGQRVRGLARVGLYVPGGTAAYPSSVLMNAVPAKIAGVGEIIVVTPQRKDGTANPDILAAAAICGVDRVFLMGGAQAVAAMAFGTETVPRVDKIVGPGNIFVATAKRLLYGIVDIDMVAGPSEILVLADGNANPAFIAADMLSQAEHDRRSSAILVTNSKDVAQKTADELAKQLAVLPRTEIAAEALKNYGAIIVCDTVDKMVELANELAPEHLEVMLDDPMRYVGRLDNAGSVFLGEYSPEPLGDYYAGPNHVLPTSGTARFFSPLSVDSFVKRISYISYTKDALAAASDDITLIAEREGLGAHANSIRIRK